MTSNTCIQEAVAGVQVKTAELSERPIPLIQSNNKTDSEVRKWESRTGIRISRLETRAQFTRQIARFLLRESAIL